MGKGKREGREEGREEKGRGKGGGVCVIGVGGIDAPEGWVGITSFFLALCVIISKTARERSRLLLMTNRKLHVRFRLAPRSMTAISSNFLGISRDFADLGGNNG